MMGKPLVAQALNPVSHICNRASEMRVEVYQTRSVVFKIELISLEHRYLMIGERDEG